MLFNVTVIEVPRELGSECMSINLKNQSSDRSVGRVVAVPTERVTCLVQLALLITEETLIMGVCKGS